MAKGVMLSVRLFRNFSILYGHPQKTVKRKTIQIIVYWDIVRKNFRQFEKDSFIKLENVEDSLSDFIEKYPDLEDNVKLAKKKLKEKPKKKESEEKEDSKDDKDKKAD